MAKQKPLVPVRLKGCASMTIRGLKTPTGKSMTFVKGKTEYVDPRDLPIIHAKNGDGKMFVIGDAAQAVGYEEIPVRLRRNQNLAIAPQQTVQTVVEDDEEEEEDESDTASADGEVDLDVDGVDLDDDDLKMLEEESDDEEETEEEPKAKKAKKAKSGKTKSGKSKKSK